MSVLAGILLTILKVLGIVLLAVIALLAALLLLPVTATARYEDFELTLKLRILGIPITVYPLGDRLKKLFAKKPTEEKQPEQKPDGESKPKRMARLPDLDTVRELLDVGKETAGYLLRRISLKDVEAVVVVNGDDAGEIGVESGRLWAAFGAANAFLARHENIEIKRLEVWPNFLGADVSHFFSARLRLRPVSAVAAGLILLKYWSRKKRAGKTAKNKNVEEVA